jgi:hypothetical protein
LGRGARETGSADRKHESPHRFREPTYRFSKTADWEYTSARQCSKSEYSGNCARLELADSAHTGRQYPALDRQPKYFHDSRHFTQRFAVRNFAQHDSGHYQRCVRNSEPWRIELKPGAADSGKYPRQRLDAARRSGDDADTAQSMPAGSFHEWRHYAASVPVSGETPKQVT